MCNTLTQQALWTTYITRLWYAKSWIISSIPSNPKIKTYISLSSPFYAASLDLGLDIKRSGSSLLTRKRTTLTKSKGPIERGSVLDKPRPYTKRIYQKTRYGFLLINKCSRKGITDCLGHTETCANKTIVCTAVAARNTRSFGNVVHAEGRMRNVLL